jgi:hypothetical protein
VLVERAEPSPRAIVPGDYDTLERVVRETLAAGGQVAVVPPGAVRERVSEPELRDVAAGRPTAMANAGNALHADVVVLVRMAPISNEREETQLTATARNMRDAQQIATAAATVGAPPQRRQIDFTGRLLAERLVDELAAAWGDLARQPPPVPAAPPPAIPPATPATTQTTRPS